MTLEEKYSFDNCSQTSWIFNNRIENESSELLRSVTLSLLIIVPLYTLFCITVFFYYRSSYYWLYKRNVAMLMVFCGGVLWSLYPYVWRVYDDPINFPCTALIISINIDGFFFLMPFVTRLVNILIRVNFNKALIEHNFRALDDGSFFKSVVVGSDDFVTNSHKNDKVTKTKAKSYQACIFYLFCWNSSEDTPSELQFKYFLSSYRVSNTFFIFIFLVLFSFTLSIPGLFEDCTGCGVDDTSIPAIFIIYSIVLFGFFVLNSNKSVPDGLGVKHEMAVIGIALIIVDILGVILISLYGDYERRGIFVWTLLNYITVLVTLTVSFPYQVYLAINKSSSKFDDGITLSQVLDSDKGSKAFALYLATTLCLENYYFYKAVMKYKDGTDANHLNSILLAQSIYSTFIDQNGSKVINISYTMREILARQLSEKAYTLDMFDAALANVINLLEGDVFYRFKLSNYYQAFKGNIDVSDI